ncbi:uncharacterized protein LOC143217482 [Lasioglossum baleicum]|uniref:uncharacterized protein LOC143217482 n=1 Tax=Lasioglossum baleicum TaxID=434251 RepID=UPI003FCDBD78
MSEKPDIPQDTSDKKRESSGSGSGVPFKKPRFVDKWLQDPKMSPWLRKQDDGRARCSACEKCFELYSHKSVLSKHAKSIHHKMNMQKKNEDPGASLDCSDIEVPKTETKVVEIRYCLFAIEHNFSIETIQAFNKLHKSIVGSKLPSLQTIKLGKTKIRAIVKNVINKSIILDIQEILRDKYFSIIIDVSMDVSNIRNLGILVRLVNNAHLETHLLDLIPIKDATAETIFKYIVSSLNKFYLSLSKIVGIGVHNNVTTGCSEALMTSFKDSNSEIVTFAYGESVKKLPYNDRFVKGLKFLNPQIALDSTKRAGQIEIIIETFPSKVTGAKVIDQWRLLAATPSAEEKETLSKLDVIAFWNTIGDLKDESDNFLYDEVAKLAFICLSLPHSKADMEKSFSMITHTKSKERNRLSTHDLVCPIARIKLYLKSKRIDACSFQISDQMLQCFTSEMYNKEEVAPDLNVIWLTEEVVDCDSGRDVC